MHTWNAPYAYQNFPSYMVESEQRHAENQMIAEQYKISVEDVENKLTKGERKDLLEACKKLRAK